MMNTVHLGLPGSWAKSAQECSDHYTTKVGGMPDWPYKELDIKSDLLTCRLCGKSLCLVVQVHAPLSLNGMDLEERNLYVFGCTSGKCASNPLSWRALRIQKRRSGSNDRDAYLVKRELADSVVSASTSNFLDRDFWTTGNEKFGEEKDTDMDMDELKNALSDAATAASNCRKQSSTIKSKTSHDLKVKGRAADLSIRALPCFYVYFQEEPHLDTINAISANYSSLSLKGNHDTTEISDEEKWEGEVYEYDKALQADRIYLKFKKRLDLLPKQCLRYSFGGPSLLAAVTAGEPGACCLCGAPRHYEMQLMPVLLYFLHEATNDASVNSEEWDWTTVIVYTCSKSCSDRPKEIKSSDDCWTVVEEAIDVQD